MRPAAALALTFTLALAVALAAGCGGGTDESDTNGVPGTGSPVVPATSRAALDRDVLAAVRQLASRDAAQRSAATRWLRENGERAAPILAEWLRDDPGVGAPLRERLDAPPGDGLFAALDWAQALDVPESLDRLVDLALNPQQDRAVKEVARVVVSASGDPGLAAAHAYMVADVQKASEIASLMRQFPRDQALLFWMRQLGSPDPLTLESARRWVDVLYRPDDRVSAELVFRVLPELPPTIEDPSQPDKIFRPQALLLNKIKRATRLGPGDDPWLIEAVARCVQRLRSGGGSALAIIGEILHQQARLAPVVRLERWVEANEPPEDDPRWFGHQRLRALAQQVRVILERWNPDALHKDVVYEPLTGAAVPYGPDEDAEMVRSPRTGRMFRASRISYEPQPERWPGLAGGRDTIRRERLIAATAGDTWRSYWPEEAFGRPPAGVPADQRDAVDLWPLEVRNWFANSAVMRALVACGKDAAVEPLRQALAAEPDNWRVYAAATHLLARFGALPDPRGSAAPPDPTELLGSREAPLRALETARNWQALALAAALAFDPAALGRETDVLRVDGLVAWLANLAPRLGQSSQLAPRNPLVVEARLGSAWAWALTRQQALRHPEVWDVPLERWLAPADDTAAELAHGVEPAEVTWAQLVALHAWMRLADEETALRDVAAMRLLEADDRRVRAALRQFDWRRHPWMLELVTERVLTDPAAARPTWVDVLQAFEWHSTEAVFTALMVHDDAAIRAAAVGALPPTDPWLTTLRNALADPAAEVVRAAAAQLLSGPRPDALAAAELLWREDRPRLIARLHLLPTTEAVHYLQASLDDPAVLPHVARAVRALPERVMQNAAAANANADADADADASAAAGAIAEARAAYVATLAPYIGNPEWGTPDDRRAMLQAAVELDSNACRPLLRALVVDDPVQRVREAALQALLHHAGAEDVPVLLDVLSRTASVQTKRHIIQFFERNEPLVAEPGVVDALLPFLRQKDADGLWAEAQLALITPSLGSVDERIVPAFVRAYLDGVMNPLTVQPARFIMAHPTEEAMDVLARAIVDPNQLDIRYIQDFLAHTYYRFPSIRDRFRRLWPTLPYGGRVRLAEVFARPVAPVVLDATWIDRLLATEWEAIEGLPVEYQKGRMPDEIALALAFLAGIQLPDNAQSALAALHRDFPSVEAWRQWWQPRRQRWIERAEQEFQQRVAAAQAAAERGSADE